MAIQQATTTPYGINLASAYIKVTFFNGSNKYVQYQVQTFADAAARQIDRQPVDERSFSFEYAPGQGDILVACYNDLMARPEYANCVVV